MRIGRIVCKNLRAVPDFDLLVREHLVVVGPNASGKTSLLRALDVMLGGTFGQLVNSLGRDALRDPADPLEIEVHFESFTDDDRAAFPDEINVTGDGEARVEGLTLALTVAFDGDDPDVVRVFRKSAEDRRVRAEHLAAIGWGFLPATRSPERELGAGRRSALGLLVASIDLGATEAELKGLIAEANTVLDGTESVVALRERLATELTGVLPRRVAAGDLSIQVSTATDDDPIGQAQVLLNDHTGEPQPLHRQSDGLRALSTIVVQRLATPAAILGVDEPEIHLHPRSQARLGKLLATGAGQRIVATHASAVLSAFEPVDVVALVGASVRQLRPMKVAANPKFFARWWDDAALEPLTSRTVALVEGPSDRVLLRRVATLLNHDLDRLDCSVVLAHGAPGFAPLIKLYGAEGFELDVLGLVDADQVAKVAKELDVEADAAALRAAGWEVSDPDLEGECVAGLGVQRHCELIVRSGYYNEPQILGSLHAATVDDIDPLGFAEWCRHDKVLHAVALASAMETADARAIASLVSLLDTIANQ